MPRAMVWLLGVAAASAALGACGGDSDGGGGDGQSAALSAGELREKAGDICDRAEKESDALDNPGDLGDPDQAAKVYGDLQEIAEREYQDLDALTPPTDLKRDWEALVAIQKEGSDQLQEIVDKAKARNPTGISEDVANLGDIGARFVAGTKKVGATRCAR